MSRKIAREIAMRLIYQKELAFEYSMEALEDMIDKFRLSKNGTCYVEEIIYGVEKKVAEIDKHIKENVRDWRFDRISKIDLAILRLAIYEIIWAGDIPYKVSINEAVELAKLYGSEKSSSFVNGILGGVVRSLGLEDDGV